MNANNENDSAYETNGNDSILGKAFDLTPWGKVKNATSRDDEALMGLGMVFAHRNNKMIDTNSEILVPGYNSLEMRNLIADAAALSTNVYPISGSKETPFYSTKSKEWHLLTSKNEIKIGNGSYFAQEVDYNSLVNNTSGLHSYIFLQVRNDNVINIAYVFRGTVSKRDIYADIEQGIVGRFSQQYKHALNNAQKIIQLQKRFLPNAKLYFMGHSLGGGLAGHCGIITNKPVIGFNSASVHLTTIGKYNNNYQNLMRNNRLLSIYVEGEVLSSKISPLAGLPKYGTRVGISKNAIKAEGIGAPIERHKMENICDFYGLQISKNKSNHYI